MLNLAHPDRFPYVMLPFRDFFVGVGENFALTAL